MREEPKPCPFCGCGAEVQEISGSYGYESPKLRIACTQCFAATGWRKTEEWKQGVGTYSIEDKVRLHLVADWNRRTPDPEKQELAEALRKADNTLFLASKLSLGPSDMLFEEAMIAVVQTRLAVVAFLRRHEGGEG